MPAPQQKLAGESDKYVIEETRPHDTHAVEHDNSDSGSEYSQSDGYDSSDNEAESVHSSCADGRNHPSADEESGSDEDSAAGSDSSSDDEHGGHEETDNHGVNGSDKHSLSSSSDEESENDADSDSEQDDGLHDPAGKALSQPEHGTASEQMDSHSEAESSTDSGDEVQLQIETYRRVEYSESDDEKVVSHSVSHSVSHLGQLAQVALPSYPISQDRMASQTPEAAQMMRFENTISVDAAGNTVSRDLAMKKRYTGYRAEHGQGTLTTTNHQLVQHDEFFADANNNRPMRATQVKTIQWEETSKKPSRMNTLMGKAKEQVMVKENRMKHTNKFKKGIRIVHCNGVTRG